MSSDPGFGRGMGTGWEGAMGPGWVFEQEWTVDMSVQLSGQTA